jgi:hypothetical protein
MKKTLCFSLGIAVLLWAITSIGHAGDRGGSHGGRGYYHGGGSYHGSKGYYHGGGHYHSGSSWRTSIWIGPGWGGWTPWWGPAYYPYRYSYPYYYPYYPYYSDPPAVIQQQPPVYVQPEEQYWYYCQNPEGYYPYIRKCPGGWMKVVPSAPPDEEE